MSDPLVSVGLPVYNGEDYVAEAIESILAQTYRNFELLINDNASTDRTEAICTAYAAADERVMYARNQTNLGAAANYNATIDRARGPYFKWIAHDDVCRPAFLERCVAVLETDPAAVAVYATPRDMDASGTLLSLTDTQLGFDHPDRVRRMDRALNLDHTCLAVFGVIRSDALRRTGQHGSYPGADRVLLGELALRGTIVEVPEELMLHREHPGRFINQHATAEERFEWFDTNRVGRLAFPKWRRLREQYAAVSRTPLGPVDRMRSHAVVTWWGVTSSPLLARDVVHAGRVWARRKAGATA